MPSDPGTRLHRSVDVDLPPDQVWELLVDDDERADWFGGPTTLDATPGGEGTFTDPDGTRRRAVVEETAPGRRLAWTWWPEADDDGCISRVEIDLRPAPGGTRVSVTEAPLVPTARASSRATASAGHLPLLELEITCLLRARGRVLA